MREKREIARAPANARSEGREGRGAGGRNKNSSRAVAREPEEMRSLFSVIIKKFQDGHNLI